MYKQIINNLKPGLDRAINYLKEEFSSLQAGRANPSLVEDIIVECYDQKMPLKQVASIQMPEPRVIIIRPWDKEIIKNIELSIKNSKLGLNPSLDSDIIRLNIPSLNEERRKELTKIISEKAEEAKISIRRQREDAWREIQDLEKEKQILEDDKFRAKDELQKIIDEYNGKIDAMKKKKEGEIMTV